MTKPFGFPELLARMRTGLLGATYAPVDGGTDPLAGAIAALVSKSFVDGCSGSGEIAMFP